MRKTVSIREVAKLAGVSTATVSNVYSGKKRVNEDLAKRVREAGDELGYRVHRIASQLRSGKNNIVGVLVPDLSDPFFTSIITELENLAQTSGYEIIVANSNDNQQTEEGRLNTLLSSRPAGLVVIPCTDSIPSQLLEEDIPPFVLADRVFDMNVTDTVVIDNYEAGATAAVHLVKLGHRKLLVAASDLRFQPVRERYRGAKEVFLNIGGVAAVIEVGSKPFEGAAILKDWLNKNDRPTAILATTGKTTLAVLAVTADLKLDIPDHISLVGFDDYPWMSVRKVPLTVINQPVPDISRSVWECLNARMAGEEFARKKIVLSCTLEVRDSTRAVKSL